MDTIVKIVYSVTYFVAGPFGLKMYIHYRQQWMGEINNHITLFGSKQKKNKTTTRAFNIYKFFVYGCNPWSILIFFFCSLLLPMWDMTHDMIGQNEYE